MCRYRYQGRRSSLQRLEFKGNRPPSPAWRLRPGIPTFLMHIIKPLSRGIMNSVAIVAMVALIGALFVVTADSFVVPARALYAAYGLPNSDIAGSQQRLKVWNPPWSSCRGGCQEGVGENWNGVTGNICMSASAATSSVEGIDTSGVLGDNRSVLSQKQRNMVSTLLELGQVCCISFITRWSISLKQP